MIKRNILTAASCMLLCLIAFYMMSGSFSKTVILMVESDAVIPADTIISPPLIDSEEMIELDSNIFNTNDFAASIDGYYFGAAGVEQVDWQRKEDVVSKHDLLVQQRREEKERVFREFLSLHVDSGFTYYTKYHDAREDKVYSIKMSKDWQKFVYSCCKKYKIEKYYEVVLGIMGVESGFDVYIGKKQNPKTGVVYIGPGMINFKYNYDYLLDNFKVDIQTVEGQTEAVCVIFSQMLKRFNYNIAHALMAYNGGASWAESQIAKNINHNGYTDKVIMIANGLRK